MQESLTELEKQIKLEKSIHAEGELSTILDCSNGEGDASERTNNR